MSTDILGVKYPSPIVIAPVGGQQSFHPEGEAAVARAAKAGDHLQILSTVTNVGVEDIVAARGAPVWYQLYATNKWDVSKALVTRAEKAGCTAVAITVDRSGGRNQEDAVPPAPDRHARLQRLSRSWQRSCRRHGAARDVPRKSISRALPTPNHRR